MFRAKYRSPVMTAKSALLPILLCAAPPVLAQNASIAPSVTQRMDTRVADENPPRSPSDADNVAPSAPAALSLQPRKLISERPSIWGVSQLLRYKTRSLSIMQDKDKSAPQSPDQSPKSAEAQAPPSRALPSPLDSPPFPSSDWVVPVIGAPDSTPDYPLQKALFGDRLKKSRIKVYGWLDAGIVLSNSKNSLSPYSYNILPNRPVLDQAVLRVERVPDTAQTDHVDWGFRLSNVFGVDYRTTVAKGWFSDPLLKHNNLYGYDPVEFYGLVYVPKVA